MALFTYVARTAAGERMQGQLQAASEQALIAELQARSLAPVEVREVRERTGLRRRVPARQLAGVYRQLADLLHAGVPLLRALRLLARGKANARLAGVLGRVSDAVADGGALADAMAEHPDAFPAVHVAMVRAGEKGGFLEEVLARLGTFLEHQAEMRARVVGSLLYPVVVLCFGAIVVVAAMVGLVPQFRDFYARIDLPLPTKILLGTSDLLVEHGVLLLLGAAALGAAAFTAWRRPAVRRRAAELSLQVPQLGALLRAVAVARFARILGTLLANGIPMLSAMQISREAAGNPVMEGAILEATDAVRAGEPLSVPLGRSGLFAEDMIEIIAVGEAANNLPDVLLGLADAVERRIDRLVGTLVKILEPMLLVGMGGIVFFIFVALVVPMLRMRSAI